MSVSYEKAVKIVDKYGINHQRFKAAEELAELQTIVLQDANNNGKVSIDHIAEEIADVYIVLKQLEAIYLLDDEDIQPIIDFKLERTLGENRNERWEEKAKAEANLYRR